MSLLYRILYAAHANGTHHKLAMRSLDLMRCKNAEAWRRVFLKHAKEFMAGSKAPDTEFKDFRNHVLHVDDGDWGGAREAAEEWYRTLVADLRREAWGDAARAAGVLSHYLSDPLMPLHTGGSEAEANVHRGVEWCISRSFETLWDMAPEVELSAGDGQDWLSAMLREGAVIARSFYWPLITHYDLHRGAVNPVEGLDAEGRSMIAPLLAHAAAAIALAVDRAIDEADATPPTVSLTLDTVVAGLEIPARWVTARLEDAEDRRIVTAMAEEMRETGRVEKNLTEDVRTVRYQRRADDAKERKIAEKPAPADVVAAEIVASERRRRTARSGSGGGHLSLSSAVERAPSIGPKTADRLAAVGVHTVEDLVTADPKRLASRLRQRWITRDEVAKWRDQAMLMVQLRNLTGEHAVLLVAAGYKDLKAVASADPTALRAALVEASTQDRVRRALRDPKAPDLGKVVEWVGMSRGALAAA